MMPLGNYHVAMYALYLGGWTLEEVGREYGTSRQRIEQILFQENAYERYPLAVRRNAKQRLRQRFDEYLANNPLPDSREEIAEILDVEMWQVQGTLTEREARLISPVRDRRPIYTEKELIEALRLAALSLPSPMTVAAYQKFYPGRMFGDKPWPSNQTIMKRLGNNPDNGSVNSWNLALATAGLPHRTHRGGGQTRFSLEAAIDAVNLVWDRLGKPPIARDYEALSPGLREEGHDIPSLATARKFAPDGKWVTLRRLAAEKRGAI